MANWNKDKIREENANIGVNEIKSYLADSSDFGFELQCLSHLEKTLKFKCKHSGSYIDHIKGKPRQYDIRAEKDCKLYTLKLAVECKSISSPLLIFRTQRTQAESYHYIIHTNHFLQTMVYANNRDSDKRIQRIHKLEGNNSFYDLNGMVGKKCEQITYNGEGRLVGNDSDIYEKWSQALGSSYDLIIDSYKYHKALVSLVIPILLVPDGMLWSIDYQAGVEIPEPISQQWCSFYVEKEYEIQRDRPMIISHLEIATFSGLDQVINHFCRSDTYGYTV